MVILKMNNDYLKIHFYIRISIILHYIYHYKLFVFLKIINKAVYFYQILNCLFFYDDILIFHLFLIFLITYILPFY